MQRASTPQGGGGIKTTRRRRLLFLTSQYRPAKNTKKFAPPNRNPVTGNKKPKTPITKPNRAKITGKIRQINRKSATENRKSRQKRCFCPKNKEIPPKHPCRQVSQSVTECHKVSRNVMKCHRMSQNVTKCHKVSVLKSAPKSTLNDKT